MRKGERGGEGMGEGYEGKDGADRWIGIKKRHHKLLDYDSLRAKVKKLVEKPDKDPSKLPRAEKEAQMARDVYEALNEQLTNELPQLIDLRVPYLDPSFEALVKIQLKCKCPVLEGTDGTAQIREDWGIWWMLTFPSLRGSILPNGPSPAIPQPRNARPVRKWIPRPTGGAGAAGDSGFEHSWCFIALSAIFMWLSEGEYWGGRFGSLLSPGVTLRALRRDVLAVSKTGGMFFLSRFLLYFVGVCGL